MKTLPLSMALLAILVSALLIPACARAQMRRGGGSAAQSPALGATSATPPAPPSSGPGSASYAHAGVTKNLYGEGALAYWVFEPANPAPASAPVVLFLHGWRATDPRDYGGWIDHLARKGNIVLYPVFEGGRSDSTDEIMAHAIQGTKDALERIKQGPIRPDLDRFAIVGHSLGGGLTSQVAARVQASGLPTPKVIMPTQPGWKGNDAMPTDKLGDIPASVLMLIVVGSQDQFASTRQGKVIYSATKQIPPDQKRYVTIQGDNHGSPPLIADHSSPLAFRPDYGVPATAAQQRRIQLVERVTGMRENTANALNYWGYYRLFDALADAGFSGKKIDAALAGAQPSGKWSDGAALQPFLVTASP